MLPDKVPKSEDKNIESPGSTLVATKSKKHYYDNGDTVIISSDDVHFKVPAYYLQAASTVFRGMIEIGNKDDCIPIELSDKEDEASEILDSVFDLVIKKSKFLDTPANATPSVVRFLRKYEFDRDLDVCALQLGESLALQRDPWNVFWRSTHLEDHELSGRALEKAEIWTWTAKDPKDASDKFGISVPKGRVVDFRAISRTHLGDLPLDSIWAFMRASAKLPPHELVGGTSPSTKAMSEEYVRLMKLRDAPKVSAAST